MKHIRRLLEKMQWRWHRWRNPPLKIIRGEIHFGFSPEIYVGIVEHQDFSPERLENCTIQLTDRNGKVHIIDNMNGAVTDKSEIEGTTTLRFEKNNSQG